MLPRPQRRQRGITLVESLVGLLVLSLGLVGAMRLQSWLRVNSDIARQRTEAVRLAQQDMEQLRAFADMPAFAGMAGEHSEVRGDNTAFTLMRNVSSAPDAALKNTQLLVSWADRSGHAQTVQLQSSVAGISPRYSAALALAPQDKTLAPRRQLPVAAHLLGDGRSVHKPSSRSTVAWIIDNATGLVTSQCTVAAGLSARDITEADLGSCSPAAGALLSGHIRFSLGHVPDAARPNDPPLALSVGLVLDTPGAARCEVDAAPARSGAERHIAYTCILPTQVDNGWSGQLRIAPEGWSLGDAATAFKVCRYSADLDGSGRIDRNAEHPEHYRDVRGPLLQQNYLVIRGDATCTGALTPHNEASLATVQHQP